MPRSWSWDRVMERLGPVTVKELRQGLRRRMFTVPFLLMQGLAVLATAVEFEDPVAAPYTPYAGMLNVFLLIPGTPVFTGPFWGVVALVCLLLMPLGGLALMSQELEKGNHELLLMTPLTRWQVVLGKFWSLWGLCLLAVISLAPYAIVRYLVGGMDVWRNFAAGLTVVAASAILCAGALGASAFRATTARVATMALFLGSAMVGCGVPLAAAAAFRDEGCGFWFHLNAIAAIGCYTSLGLSLARSRIRLTSNPFEAPPSLLILMLLAVAPIAAVLTSLITVGYFGGLGLACMGAAAFFGDQAPRVSRECKAPVPNLPSRGAS